MPALDAVVAQEADELGEFIVCLLCERWDGYRWGVVRERRPDMIDGSCPGIRFRIVGRHSEISMCHCQRDPCQSDRKGGISIDPVGYYAGKKIKGVERNAFVDTEAHLLSLEIIPANTRIASAPPA